MSNQDEKFLFSQRLKSALDDAQHPISPTYLAKQFNHRYSGDPVSVQAANTWLTAKAIPSQDKLAVLAIWLNRSAQWLRFGDSEYTDSTQLHYSEDELDYFLKFKKLNTHQQTLIKNLINEFLDRS